MALDRKILGAEGEAQVCTYLEKKGFTIIEKNFSCRYGEVDIIARQAEVLAFIEVKTRCNDYFSLSEVITPSKRRKIITATKWYMAQHDITDTVCRFDVVLVFSQAGGFSIEYLENAFEG